MAGGVVEKPAGYGGGGVPNYLNHVGGIKSWLITLDHKRIALMYLVAVSTSLLLGGFFAVALRTVLLSGAVHDPNDLMLGMTVEQMYNKFFTLHGAVMVFMFIIPGIPASLGNFILPMQLGAKDLALPRVNLFSLYLYWIGATMFVCVLAFGGLDTGWTLYPPYSLDRDTSLPLIFALGAVFILGFSSILTGLNFIVTMHRLRPPGMTMYDMPLFLWALYATSLIQVLATPVIGITLGMAMVEHIFHIGIFLPQYGGDPVLFQHFFWFYSHPAVYIMILPALGVQSELIATFSRKHVFGYKAIAWSSIAIAAIGFIVWGHHMFVSGQSPTTGIIFSFLTFLVAVPSAIKVFNWVATLYKGSIELKTPMLYGLAFMYLFGIGGLTGMFLAAIGNNVHLHDTYFVIAHFHMVMVGSTLNAFFGGVHYWWPKMTGRMYNETLGKIACLFVFIGFNLAFMPQFVAGTRGMPRRYANYQDEFTIFHQTATIGAYFLGLGVVMQVVYLAFSLYKQRPQKWSPISIVKVIKQEPLFAWPVAIPLSLISYLWVFAYNLVLIHIARLIYAVCKSETAPMNPWGAASLEWQSESPPDFHNFTKKPIVMAAYDFENWEFDPNTGGYELRKEVVETGRSLVSAHH